MFLKGSVSYIIESMTLTQLNTHCKIMLKIKKNKNLKSHISDYFKSCLFLPAELYTFISKSHRFFICFLSGIFWLPPVFTSWCKQMAASPETASVGGLSSPP
ncbi:hypothetical protein ILYODFUR_033143 [Ilyodon furcidens]|uniref:Uncharacterized protein n=1 Tax=Ilyodon furcidens TaxID=33524 RepID=A0ABV0V143_9TELE